MNLLASCALFLLVALALVINHPLMMGDPDSGWHLAAGDLIRTLGTLPKTDPWSFTAQGHPWVNLAWMWDVWMSHLNSHLGWHGQIAFTACIIALTITILYQACLLRSGNGIASFLAVLLFLVSGTFHLRPMWVSHLFIALLFYVALLIEYRKWNSRWWLLMPALMPLWVNLHGGFIIAFVLLGVFGFQALQRKEHKNAAFLAFVGLLSIAGCTVNPYGVEAVLNVIYVTMTTPALQIILEFKATSLGWGFLLGQLFIPIFFFFAIKQQTKTSLAEAILVFGFLVLSCTSVRYWVFFFIFACPLLAQYLAHWIENQPNKAPHPAAAKIILQIKEWFFSRYAMYTRAVTLLMTASILAWLFTPMAGRYFQLDTYQPYENILPAINFVEKHYPHHRFFTEYSIGGPVIQASRGAFPVFIDGRGETAYPRAVVQDFTDAMLKSDGMDILLRKYQINGAIIAVYPRDPFRIVPRFTNNSAWKEVYRDDLVAIFVKP